MKSILTPARTEEGKAERRRLGDNGGVSFRNKVLTPRPDGTSNTITSVQKDNLLIEIYEISDNRLGA